jgi:hypothetical protein
MALLASQLLVTVLRWQDEAEAVLAVELEKQAFLQHGSTLELFRHVSVKFQQIGHLKAALYLSMCAYFGVKLYLLNKIGF